MTAPDLSADRRYCRAVLPRVSRTFALNIRLLRGDFGEAVRVAYLLCRAADALEDSWPGTPDVIAGRFDHFTAALTGDRDAARELSALAAEGSPSGADLGLVVELSRLLRVLESLPASHRPAVVEGVTTLASGMSRYAARAAGREPGAPYLDTEAELSDYCWVVAGCVGVMLTQLFAAEYGGADPATERARIEIAPEVGRALQLTNILLDWPVDLRHGRCHLPADWLREHGLRPSDLVRRDHPGVRAIADRLEGLARASLARVPDYLDLIPRRRVRYRLFCLWPTLWALGSLRHARRDPEFPWGPRRPKLPRSQVWRSALGSVLAARDGAAIRRLCAAIG